MSNSQNTESDKTGMNELYELLKTIDYQKLEELSQNHPWESDDSMLLALLTAAIFQKPKDWLENELGLSKGASEFIGTRIIATAISPSFKENSE